MLKTISRKYGNVASDLTYVSGWNYKLSFAFSQMKLYPSVAKEGSTKMTPKSTNKLSSSNLTCFRCINRFRIDSVGCSSFGPAGGLPETFKVP